MKRKHEGPTDPFIFDAPQFVNFLHPRYRRRKAILHQLIVANQTPTKELFQITNLSSQADEIDEHDEWFRRPHPSHEPSEPLTPVGPLITPPHGKPVMESARGLRAAPQRVQRASNVSSTSSFRLSSLPCLSNLGSTPPPPMPAYLLSDCSTPPRLKAAKRVEVKSPLARHALLEDEDPPLKRIKVDAKFTPAPTILPEKKKPAPVKMDDLKRLLALHNQRIRPRPK